MKLIEPVIIDDDLFVSSTVPEDDHPEWSAAATYPVGERVMVAAEHARYESLRSNTNKPPATNRDDWLKLGATNRWAAFDNKVGTVTSANGAMTIVMRPGRISSLALFNVTAQNIHIEMVDPAEGVVFDRTYTMQDYTGVVDYWEHFFSPIILRRSLIIDDLPTYGAADLRVAFDSGGVVSTVSCGAIVPGTLRTFAKTVLAGVSVGLRSFSRKEQDEFGNWQVVKRANSKRELLVCGRAPHGRLPARAIGFARRCSDGVLWRRQLRQHHDLWFLPGLLDRYRLPDPLAVFNRN